MSETIEVRIHEPDFGDTFPYSATIYLDGGRLRIDKYGMLAKSSDDARVIATSPRRLDRAIQRRLRRRKKFLKKQERIDEQFRPVAAKYEERIVLDG